jgi:hypothetical protein
MQFPSTLILPSAPYMHWWDPSSGCSQPANLDSLLARSSQILSSLPLLVTPRSATRELYTLTLTVTYLLCLSIMGIIWNDSVGFPWEKRCCTIVNSKRCLLI